MVEVLKKVDDSMYKEVVCRKCGALLKYSPVDVVSGYATDYGGGREAYNYIVCPNDIPITAFSSSTEYSSDVVICNNKVEVNE